MDKLILIIDTPKLSDETASVIQNTLHTLMDVFDANYGDQVARFYRSSVHEAAASVIRDDQDPF